MIMKQPSLPILDLSPWFNWPIMTFSSPKKPLEPKHTYGQNQFAHFSWAAKKLILWPIVLWQALLLFLPYFVTRAAPVYLKHIIFCTNFLSLVAWPPGLSRKNALKHPHIFGGKKSPLLSWIFWKRKKRVTGEIPQCVVSQEKDYWI